LKALLKNISTIQTGVFAKPESEGEIVYLQAKHFFENGTLDSLLHPDLKLADIGSRHLLQPGDVLFAAKGSKNFAAVYESHNPAAVASTSFFVLRFSQSQLLPNYLTWFLNNPSTQVLLKGQAIGTSIPSISKQVLENLEIPLPHVETQKVILEISKLRAQEKSLKHEIEILREKKIQQQIINAIK
jgi:hypothetical protein